MTCKLIFGPSFIYSDILTFHIYWYLSELQLYKQEQLGIPR